MKKQRMNAYTLAFTGVMAAIVYVVTLFRFPLLGSKVHFANAMCLLSGMLFGGVYGGLAAGLGSALYDAFHGYDVINILITFVSKFMMAWVCARVLWSKDTRSEGFVRAIVAAVCGPAVGVGTTLSSCLPKTRARANAETSPWAVGSDCWAAVSAAAGSGFF